MTPDSELNIFVAGHTGMVGSSIIRQLEQKYNVITRTRSELDLTDQSEVRSFFKKNKIDQVYLAAAKVGGIFANNEFPADFIYQNIMIESNVIKSAFDSGVKKLLFLGSSCIYPLNAPQPMSEEALLSGKLEPTNEPYAIAKIAGIKLCESFNRQFGNSHGIDYRSLMPTNLFGVGDSYHPNNSHVVPALIRRFHESKYQNLTSVRVWGSGSPKREFLYVDDMAKASIFVMNLSKEIYERHTTQMNSHINVGSGQEITIKELAQKIAQVVGYKGAIFFDKSMPDGSPRKLINSQRLLSMGWRPKEDIDIGLSKAYEDFLNKYK